MNHSFSDCTTDYTPIGIFNSFLSIAMYLVSISLNYLPTPESLVSAIIIALVTSCVAFFATKLYGKIYNYIFCRPKKVVKIEIKTTETDI